MGFLLVALFVPIFFVYYVFGPTETLTFYPHGTLKGIESLSYAAAGLLFAFTGGGRFALDPPTFRRLSAAGPTRRLCSRPEPETAAVAIAGFRMFVGSCVAFHGVLQLWFMDDFTRRLGEGIGVARLTLPAWLVVVATIGVALLLTIGLYTRVACLLLIPLMAVTLISVPSLGNSLYEPGLDGEEFFIYAVAGFFFLCTGSSRFALDRRDASPSRHRPRPEAARVPEDAEHPSRLLPEVSPPQL